MSRVRRIDELPAAGVVSASDQISIWQNGRTRVAEMSGVIAGAAALVPPTVVNGFQGPTITLGKADVGLGFADNTSDANKPISTLQAAALAQRFNLTAPNTIPRTGLFFTAWNQTQAGALQPPAGAVGAAKLHKINDRVQIGLACLQSGDFPATAKDPLDAFEASRSDPRGFRSSWAQLSVGSEVGGIAVNAYAFTSSMSEPTFAGFQLGMAFCGTGVNDNTTVQQLLTTAYFVAFRRPGAGVASGTGTCAAEIDMANEGNSLSISPSSTYPAGGFTIGLQLNSGAISPFATDASAALTFGQNGAKWLTGLVVGQDALSGVTIAGGKATGGYGSLIRAGAFQGLEWWNNDGSAPTNIIVSEQLTPANQQSIRFQDSGIVLGGAALAGRSFQALYVGNATGAWVQVAPAVGTTPCTITAGGQTNADLAVRSQGSGVLVLDKVANSTTTATAGTASALPTAPAGYLKIKLGDNGTTILKIPYYNT